MSEAPLILLAAGGTGGHLFPAEALAAEGLVQVLSYPFVGTAQLDAMNLPAGDARRRALRLANPISEAQPLMRTDLLVTLLDTARRNVGRGQSDLALFSRLAKLDASVKPEEAPMRVLIPAFVTSELKSAFQIGFLIFIPFLIIDMIVASVLMSLGMMMLSPVLVALPFKLMLFVLADGWNLLLGSLAASFVT